MYRRQLTQAALLAMLATAFETGAVCPAGNPNASLIESTPTGAFTDPGNGTITHNLTGLMWKQCAQGLSGAGCATGTIATMTWSGALAVAVADTTAGYADWRLPNKKELESIVESCGYQPAINQSLFPATPGSSFWSGSSYAPIPTGAWFVNFGDGYADFVVKTGVNYVRLVRGGLPFDAFDAQNPTIVIATLDVDASITASKYDALTDGLLIIRYLFGLTGTSLTNGALGGTATRTDPAVIKTYLDGIRTSLDIDANGTADALTDGLLILRYMFGLRGTSLIAGAVDPLGSRNTAAAIEAYIQSLMP
jgi:Protein of unknown function (DUF1566)